MIIKKTAPIFLVLIISLPVFAENILVNSLKTKELRLTPYVQRKLDRSKTIKPLSFNDFPEDVKQLYDDFTVSLPNAFLADFNEDGKTDVAFLTTYKSPFSSKKKGMIMAAVSTSTNQYKIHKVYKYGLIDMSNSGVSKNKGDKDDQHLRYLVDQNSKNISKKPIVLETYRDSQKKFVFDGRKFKFQKNSF